MQQCVLRFLAAQDAAGLPAQAVADQLRALERTDAVGSALRGRLLEVFDAQDGHLADGQRTTRTWLVHSLRVTKGQAGEYQAVQALARSHRVLHAALAEGWVITKSEALQLARWTRAIPEEYRAEAEEILVAAARAGVDLRGLAAICAEIRARTARARPRRRQRHAPGPRGVAGHHVRGRRRRPRRPDPRMRRDGPGRPGRPVRPAGRRGPADPPAALPRRAGRGDEAACWLRTCCRSGPGSRSRPWSTSTSPSSARWTTTGSCRTSGSPSTGRSGPPTAPPTRSAPGTAAPGSKATPPGRSPATR